MEETTDTKEDTIILREASHIQTAEVDMTTIIKDSKDDNVIILSKYWYENQLYRSGNA